MAQYEIKGYLKLFKLPSTTGALEAEAEDFRQMAQRVRASGILDATRFECAVLNKAIEEGPERLASAVRHFNGQGDYDKMMILARQGERLLPFIDQKELLSEWSAQHIRRYLVKGRLKGMCEVRLQETARFMTHFFLISELIKTTREPEAWAALVAKMKDSLIKMTGSGGA